MHSHDHGHQRPVGKKALLLAAFGALGVVYGDIGTSPLYAMKECLASAQHGVVANPDNVLGVLSLMLWALILVVCVKYLGFVLRADNKGEGGILALAALVEDSGKKTKRGLSVALLLGLFGAGLLFGDGIITPAITTLGAMEGIVEQNHSLAHLVVPITIAILVGLFLVQRHGTGKLGVAFGPIMLIWFFAIGIMGVYWTLKAPQVLYAINPALGVSFLLHHGIHGFLIVGLVFLCVTGGEALYADMGHFGKTPIRIAWFTIALPGLLLNYFGQGALFLTRVGAKPVVNPFYEMVPDSLVIPMVILSTMAAIIASQALISGVFSLTRQAMQLGFWPRVTVVHTSAQTEGQIYIPEMNWLLMIGCIILVIQFRTSSNLAAAYGIAVTGTMGITTYLYYLVARRRWHESKPRALAFFIPFIIIDLTFFLANSAKILEGGWFPLAVGVLVFGVMTTWWRGRKELSGLMETGSIPEDLFLMDIAANPPPRVKGTAVFMSPGSTGIPNVLMHHLKHNQVLHDQVVLFSIHTENVPFVNNKVLEVHSLGQGFFRVTAHVGFMQSPDVPKLLGACTTNGIKTEPMLTTYYLGRQTLLTTGRTKMARWRKATFSFLSKNARSPSAFFNLPPNRVVELGLQIEL
ncbi:potassium transporter Kup [soil metagenome]